MFLCCGAILLLLIQTPSTAWAARKVLASDGSNLEQYQRNTNNYRHYQETSGDTADPAGGQNQSSSDQSSDESTGSSDWPEDRPPAPSELSVIRINDTSVVLRWEFPEESQDHLQWFKVQYRSTSKKSVNNGWTTDPQEVPSTTRAYQINGLRPGNFLFSVIAVYDNDDNVLSKPLKFRIRAKSKIWPGEMPEMTAPHIYWTQPDVDYFRFKWKYDPKFNDTEYFGFLVYYRSAHIVSDFTIYNTMDTSVEIAELEPDTPYEAKVVAYNMVAVSEFSETICIRTKPKSSTGAPSSDSIDNAAPQASTQAPLDAAPATTQAPSTTTTTTTTQATTTTLSLNTFIPPLIPTSTTRRPNSFPSIPTSYPGSVGTNQQHKGNNTQSTTAPPHQPAGPSNSTSNFYQSIYAVFEPILTDQSDAMLIVRYLLLLLLPLLFIITVLIFLIRPHKAVDKKSPSEASSSNGSMNFDLEINGYFKNSFPGVEKDYQVCLNVHNGFVNNHPHIDDST